MMAVATNIRSRYTNESDAGHFDTVAPADVPFPAAGDADLNSTGTSYAGGTCTVYCHVANLPGTTGATNNNTTPLWATDTSTGCDFCHGYPPNGTHSGSADCSSCHDHVEATNDNSFVGAANIAKHINGVVDSSGCTGCHGTDPKEYPPVSFWGADKNTADGVGAHVTHMENTASFLTKEDVNGDADDWCAECHTNSRGTGGHNDGYPAEVSFVDAVESSYNGTTPSFTPEGDTDPDNGVGGSCTVYCHGANMPNGDTGGSNRTPSWGDTITGCGACHAAPPANHGAVALNNCGDCHTTTMTTGLSTITNTANHINGTIEVDTSDCASCHNSGGFGAPLVGAATDHSTDRMDAVIGGAAWTCQDCHGGHGAGTIEIANATWPGNGADIFNYTSNGEGGIALGGARAPGGSEAEICWSCHFANGISEWGTNTNTNGGIYDYDFGAVSGQPNEGWVNSAGNTGATWTSANANFGYKTAPIQSTHGVVGGSQGLDSYANISCTHCHDVHNTGGGPSGKPFLRGNWVGSPYPEDGAPYWDAGNPYPGGGVGDTFDAVPRGSNFPDGLYNRDGGYWIDQNSGVDPDFNPISGFSAEQFGGLCEKCHGNNDGTFSSDEIDSLNVYGSGTTEWVSGYNGHENSVKGGSGIDGTDSGAEVTARNIFDVRGGTTSYGNNPFMHYAGMVDPGWQGTSNTWGFRGTNTKSGSTWGYNPTHATEQVRLYNVNNWGTDFDNVALSVDGALTNDRYHQFSCSKCHNPHASRLPALMITNCLDTKHNEWDNNLQLNASGGSNNDSRSISNWTSAQNCHRLGGVMTDGGDPAFDARSDAAGVGGGWNNVTPW
jgi:predicted CxxxxCH...CXXCH cytochrome family protein